MVGFLPRLFESGFNPVLGEALSSIPLSRGTSGLSKVLLQYTLGKPEMTAK